MGHILPNHTFTHCPKIFVDLLEHMLASQHLTYLSIVIAYKPCCYLVREMVRYEGARNILQDVVVSDMSSFSLL